MTSGRPHVALGHSGTPSDMPAVWPLSVGMPHDGWCAGSDMEGIQKGHAAAQSLSSQAVAGPLMRTVLLHLCTLSPEELQLWQVGCCPRRQPCMLIKTSCTKQQLGHNLCLA